MPVLTGNILVHESIMKAILISIVMVGIFSACTGNDSPLTESTLQTDTTISEPDTFAPETQINGPGAGTTGTGSTSTGSSATHTDSSGNQKN